MWKDAAGVGHTVALPDPSTAMTARTLAGLERLSRDERAAALEALDDFYWSEYAAHHPNYFTTSDLGPIGVGLPDDYIDTEVQSADDVMTAVRNTEQAWRIDVLEAFQDYFEQTKAARDLDLVPASVKQTAMVETNGEVLWPLAHAVEALDALARAGLVVLGLDVRKYDEDGRFIEVAWSAYDGEDPMKAREHGLTALSRVDIPGDWVLVTWA
ncbi:hypothetical protein LXM50_08505 [Microbacterium sp. Au-Mic1]|uniref:hypothetical protein n=1 Tax=Microbacterium sp. Au-Mic1 TaxID=2906457 RepID=UPI001E2B13E9|nr:hypothetical protein [Microbacterium sp. Au-Mic1]MCE4026012.1 hypothetical protein [Microbacterium sp. Au-Mic1]